MNSRLELYERYVTAWSAMDLSEHTALLSETVTEDIAYRDAMIRCTGVSALAQHPTTFQE